MQIAEVSSTRTCDTPDANRVGRATNQLVAANVPSATAGDAALTSSVLPMPIRQVIIREVLITDRTRVFRPVPTKCATSKPAPTLIPLVPLRTETETPTEGRASIPRT